MPKISGFSTSGSDYTQILSPKKGSLKESKNVKAVLVQPAPVEDVKAKTVIAEPVKVETVPLLEDVKVKDNNGNADKVQIVASKEPVAIEQQSLNVDASSTSATSTADGSTQATEVNAVETKVTGSKFDSFAESTSKPSNKVTTTPTTTVTESKEVTSVVDSSKTTQSSDTVKVLRIDFNNQFSALQAQHEAEMSALLGKFKEVSEQLKTLSEQSAEQISVLKDQLGGLGGQLGTIIGKLDLFGGGNLSLRTIGLFNIAAKAGDNALEKLIGILGPNSTGKQLQSVQSRLQSVTSRFGIGQLAEGLNLLA